MRRVTIEIRWFKKLWKLLSRRWNSHAALGAFMETTRP